VAGGRRAAAEAIAAALGDAISEPAVARALAALPGEVTPSSRLLDARARRRELLAGRATRRRGCWPIAAPTASTDARRCLRRRAAGARVVVHLGDVALATTSAPCSAPRGLKLALTVVLVDNAGGGIFDFLPVASQTDAFEEHVATPTGSTPSASPPSSASPTSASTSSPQSARPPVGCCTSAPTAPENVAVHRRVHEAVAVRLAS
jgi:2-succinyl-5-enolpyruvyl-6-hydroxy-3-cyclohexene-1-carboxylate synthase